MSLHSGSPPYFDRLLQKLAVDDLDAQAAFGRHVHWGYWSDPTQAGLAVDEYGRAAEAMCLEVLQCSQVHDGQRILDVGCGFGGTIACLNERYARMYLTGLNIDRQQLRRAAAQIEPRAENVVRLVVADAAQLPLADASVDRALAVESIFHFNRELFFKEIARVLRAGGALTFSDFVPHSRAVPYIEAMDLGSNEAVSATYGAIDVSWSVDRYRSRAAEHGLTLSEVRDVTEHTLPTYDFLRQSVVGWTNPIEVEQFLRATGLLEKASRRGFIAYQIVRLEKRE